MPAARSTHHATASAVTDLSSIVLAVLGYGLVGGSSHARVFGLGIGLLMLTAGCLALSRAWDAAVIGGGKGEFARLFRGFADAAAVTMLIMLATGMADGRSWVFGVLPAAAVLAVLARLGLRHDLHRRRRRGEAMARVLAVGTEEAVAELIRRTRATPRLGWLVYAVCTPTGAGPNGGAYVEQVQVVGDLDSVPALIRGGRFDLVSVSPAPGWTPWRLQQLIGELEGTTTELAVDPVLTGLAQLHRSAAGKRVTRLADALIARVGGLVGLTYLTARRLRPTRRTAVPRTPVG
jgi:FlaA1/EpsC-like NDP-sugar epimerase